MMLILAHAYNGEAQNKFFSVPNTELSTILKKLNKSLSYYQSKLSKLLFLYEQCEVKPVRRVFRYILALKVFHSNFLTDKSLIN